MALRCVDSPSEQPLRRVLDVGPAATLDRDNSAYLVGLLHDDEAAATGALRRRRSTAAGSPRAAGSLPEAEQFALHAAVAAAAG